MRVAEIDIDKAQKSWIPLTEWGRLTDEWSVASSLETAEPALRILPGGLVLLRGSIRSTKLDYLANRKGELVKVFDMPANLRPYYLVAVPASTQKIADESAVSCIVTIRTDGEVLCQPV